MEVISRLLLKFFEHLLAFVCYPLAKLATCWRPVRDDKYFCISMSGNSYGDNIKYLAEYIARQDEGAEIVWAFTSVFYGKADCPFPKVRLYTFAYYRHILTSKYILSNARLNQRMLHKHRGQIYLNTWHGTALKRLGTDVAAKKRSWLQRLLKPAVFRFDVRNTDIMVSGSRFMSDIFRDKFLFKGRIVETGTPRNDIFFHDHPEIVEKVRSHYHIGDDTQIILYAPTFRSDGKFTYYDIDAGKLLTLWEQKTGRRCVLMVRLHPNLQYKSKSFIAQFPAGTIDASDYPDMQELLYCTDLLVTDYSSSMFDIMYRCKPVLLYVPDRKEYDRGFYFDLNELPFMVVEENSHLENSVSAFDTYIYKERVNSFMRRIGSAECGEASRQTYAILKK